MAIQTKNCYLGISGKKYGPVSEQDILRLYEQNKINGSTKFLRVGMKAWIPLSESGILVPVLDDDLPPLPEDNQKQSKIATVIPFFANGILAILLAVIGREIWGNQTVVGFYRSIDADYARVLDTSRAGYEGLYYLIWFGVVLLVVGIVMSFLKPIKSNAKLKTILWLVPMLIIIVFAIINYIPIIDYQINYQ